MLLALARDSVRATRSACPVPYVYVTRLLVRERGTVDGSVWRSQRDAHLVLSLSLPCGLISAGSNPRTRPKARFVLGSEGKL